MTKHSEFLFYKKELKNNLRTQHKNNAKLLIESAWFWQYDKIEAAWAAICKADLEHSDDPIAIIVNKKKPIKIGNFRIPSVPIMAGFTAVTATFTCIIAVLDHFSAAMGHAPLVNQALEMVANYYYGNTSIAID